MNHVKLCCCCDTRRFRIPCNGSSGIACHGGSVQFPSVAIEGSYDRDGEAASRKAHNLEIAGSNPAPGSFDVDTYQCVRGHVVEKVCGAGLTWVTCSVGATDAMSTKRPSQTAPRSVGLLQQDQMFER
jgi:hypothetical protein